MGKTHKWDFVQRKNLQHLLREGYNLKDIAEMMHVTAPTLRSELERGVREEDYFRWIKYDPVLASRYVAIKEIGEDGLYAVIDYECEKKKK